MKLLLVTSHQAYALQLRGEMLRSGAMLCDLEMAASFADATAQLGVDHFDAVLVDPDSLDDIPEVVFGELQLLAPLAPVIVLSDNTDDAAAVAAVSQGAHDYLSKSHLPVEWLLRRVRYALERRQGTAAGAQGAGSRVVHEAPVPEAPVPAPAQTRQLAGASAVPGSSNEDYDLWPAEDPSIAVCEPDDAGRSDRGAGQVESLNATCWRVLHIEHDADVVAAADQVLCHTSSHPLQVTHVGSASEGAARLQRETYDAVLLSLALPDGADLETLTNFVAQAGDVPVLVVTRDADAATAIDGMRRGAADFLDTTDPDLHYLRRATQLAIARRQRPLRIPTPQLDAAPSTSTSASRTQAATAPPCERRQHARYLLTKPIFATPVMPDGSPAATYSAEGFSVDVSVGGLRFEINNLQRLPTTHLLVGIEGLDTVLYFATVEARHVVVQGDGLDVGAQFAKGTRDLIRPENLEPSFNPSTGRFETGLALDVIMKWVEFGIFRPALFDRTFVCPQCRAIPTFRNGCRVCGSVRLHSRPLIHHFACAHVGYVSDFEQNGAVICPKCRTRNLIVGADFEHLNGPYHCLDCDWSDTELDTVGQCMKCELRFPMAQAIEEDLIGYHVNRLDPLAFINAG